MTNGEKKPFWTTLPGILTGITALLTAVAGVLIFLNPPSINSFTASPDTIAQGEIATLSWSVSGASSVTINPGIGSVPSTGSRQISPIDNTTYTLNARSTFRSSTANVDVRVINATTTSPMEPEETISEPSETGEPLPAASGLPGEANQSEETANEPAEPGPSAQARPAILYFTASPDRIRVGESSELSWNVSGAEIVRIDQMIGRVDAAGSIFVYPLETRTYTLTALSGIGRDEERVTVTVAIVQNASEENDVPTRQEGTASGTDNGVEPKAPVQQSGPKEENISTPVGIAPNESVEQPGLPIPAQPPASVDSSGALELMIIPFSFTGWGHYYGTLLPDENYFSGYYDGYLYEVSGSKNLTEGLISQVIYELPSESETELAIEVGRPLKLREGYELNVTTINPADGYVYIDLAKNGTRVSSKVISPLRDNSTIADGTYYYAMDIGEARDMITLAVHFKNEIPRLDGDQVVIDGIWQISQSPAIYNDFLISSEEDEPTAL